MAATLSLDTLTSSGSGITVLAGKTLTVEGVSVTAGSTNVQRATTDVTIGTTAGYDVAGKSEVVVAANASGANRTITLPAVGATGMSTCIITVVVDADATSTYKLMVQDASTNEVWTGYQKNDFVRLIVSNSLWVVLDHKETYFSSRYLAADQSIAANATAQLTGFTAIAEIGNMWDNINDRVTVPTNMSGYFDIFVSTGINGLYPCNGVAYQISGVWKNRYSWGGSDTGTGGSIGAAVGRETVTSAQYFEAWGYNKKSNAAQSLVGGEAGKTHFNVIFTRTY
tara:strand:- start:378 stop:1226 length:849 start_codon:yes stop_codon:yes gene_type:complete